MCKDGHLHFRKGLGGEQVQNMVGRSKPPLVLTSGFNRLKPPRSICQKAVNTGQYESEWLIEILNGLFGGRLRY